MDDVPSVKRSIIIPCYNERDRLPSTLESVLSYIEGWDSATEIMIVDDGSSDGTADWARVQAEADDRIRVEAYQPNRGKGYAVRLGLKLARGQYSLFMDADGATPIAEADKFFPVLESGQADIVIGSRRQEGAQVVAGQSALRRTASRIYSAMTALLVVRGVHDTQCGFKAFTAASAEALLPLLCVESAIFDIELLAVAAKLHQRVCEVPVKWQHDDDSRLTYDLRKSIWIWMELLRLKWRHRIVWPLSVTRVTSPVD